MSGTNKLDKVISVINFFTLSNIAGLLIPLFFMCVFATVVGNYLLEMLSERIFTVGFDMATICALLGGLILTGTFFGQQESKSRIKLRRTGICYLIATLSFIILGLSMPLWGVYGYAQPFVIATSIIGGITFSAGTWMLLLAIPGLWKRETE